MPDAPCVDAPALAVDTSALSRNILELECIVAEIRRSLPLDTLTLIGHVRSMCSEVVVEWSGHIVSQVETLVMQLAQEMLSRIAALRLELVAHRSGDPMNVSHAAGFSGPCLLSQRP